MPGGSDRGRSSVPKGDPAIGTLTRVRAHPYGSIIGDSASDSPVPDDDESSGSSVSSQAAPVPGRTPAPVGNTTVGNGAVPNEAAVVSELDGQDLEAHGSEDGHSTDGVSSAKKARRADENSLMEDDAGDLDAREAEGGQSIDKGLGTKKARPVDEDSPMEDDAEIKVLAPTPTAKKVKRRRRA